MDLGVDGGEAAARFCSVATARFAEEFGRLVFAVPSSSLYPRCEDTNGAYILLELDIAGRLHRHPGGLVSISMLD